MEPNFSHKREELLKYEVCLKKHYFHLLVFLFCILQNGWPKKALSLISSQDHCHRFSTSQISCMLRAGFEPVQHLKSRICWMNLFSSDNHHITMPFTSPLEAPILFIETFLLYKKRLKNFCLQHIFCVFFYLTQPTFCNFIWQNHFLNWDFDDVRCVVGNKRRHTTIQSRIPGGDSGR